MARRSITWDEERHVRAKIGEGLSQSEIIDWLAARKMHRNSASRWERTIRAQMEREGRIAAAPRGLLAEAAEDAAVDFAPEGGDGSLG